MISSNVQGCYVVGCGYNRGRKCHATYITVGGPSPCCDMFIDSLAKIGVKDVGGGVKACYVDNCQFNNRRRCESNGITVSREYCKADCLTFKNRAIGPLGGPHLTFEGDRITDSWKSA